MVAIPIGESLSEPGVVVNPGGGSLPSRALRLAMEGR